jgi:hypothetical protein
VLTITEGSLMARINYKSTDAASLAAMAHHSTMASVYTADSNSRTKTFHHAKDLALYHKREGQKAAASGKSKGKMDVGRFGVHADIRNQRTRNAN